VRETPVLALALPATEFAAQLHSLTSHRVAAEIALANKTAATVESREAAATTECRVVILDRRTQLGATTRVAAVMAAVRTVAAR
jgi:hypothetical protein